MKKLALGLALIACCYFGYKLARLLQAHIADGYLNQVAYDHGQTVAIFLNGTKNHVSYKLRLYNMKHQVVAEIQVQDLIQQKPSGDHPAATGFSYTKSAEWVVPETLPSGVYLWDELIPMVIHSATKTEPIVFVYDANTTNAYSEAGGENIYYKIDARGKHKSKQRSPIVSFQRPIAISSFSRGLLDWLEEQNYQIRYVVDHDLDDASVLQGAKLLIIGGHSEYWSRQARENFDQFVSSGKNVALLSGNTMWWQVRYSEDGSQMIGYKSMSDPETRPELKTLEWNHPTLNYPIISSIGQDFEYGGFGARKDHGWDGFKIINAESPLLRNTRFKKGDVIALQTNEYDGVPNKGLDAEGFPVVDAEKLNFFRYELVAFDLGFRHGLTIGTFGVFQKTATSGVIVNVGSTNWGGEKAFHRSPDSQIPLITKNIIDLLLSEESVFSKNK